MAEDGHHHVLPKDTLLKVFGGLIALTILTVAVAYVPMGPFGVPVAIGIASAKASLVVLYFMALRYDNPVNGLTFTVGITMVSIFIIFTMFDTVFRGDLDNVDAQTIEEIEREQEAERKRQERLPPEKLRVAPADNPEEQGAEASTATDEGGS